MPRNRLDSPDMCVLAHFHTGERGATSDMVGLLSAGERRFLARTAEGRSRDAEDTIRLLAVLASDTSCDVRAEAYETLSRLMGCSPAHGALLLAELPENGENEPWVQVEMVRLLGMSAAHDTQKTLQLLLPMAGSTVDWVQVEVLRCMAACWASNQQLTSQYLRQWLVSSSSAVRETAVRFVSTGRRFGRGTIPWILSPMTGDPCSAVRATCARGIGLWATEDLDLAIAALRTLSCDRSHWNVRAAVARGVTHWSRAAPHEAVEILEGLVHDSQRTVRRSAYRQLRALSVRCSVQRADVAAKRQTEPKSPSNQAKSYATRQPATHLGRPSR